MKLIVGLGNPGEKYKNNRHNVGFMFVDYLVNELTGSRVTSWKKDKYLSSNIYLQNSTLNPPSSTLILAKPTTYMNKSGEAVKKLMTNYQLPTTDLIVVHDDLDIPLGKFRIVKGYGPKLHNGIESIENKLLAQDFTRVRIGVDNRPSESRVPGIDYVLQDFGEEEKKAVLNIFSQIVVLMKAEKYI